MQRWPGGRRGIVLVLVVVLLVLLALIGTAFLSTARIDRTSAGQNTSNTQIESLCDGARGLAIGAIVDHVFSGGYGTLNGLETYRPPGVISTSTPATNPSQNPGYVPYDGYDKGTTASLALPNDAWLAARTPTRPSDVGGPGSSPVWTSVSYPLFININPSKLTATALYEFDDPTSTTPAYLTLPKPDFQPTSTTVNGVTYPALIVNGQTIVAADTDGDGIADAGLYRLPMGPVNGITYYMAVRIIDNNSGINPNTAYGPQGDAVPGGGFSTAGDAAYPTWFPGSIDLQDMLGTNELNGSTGVNQWRFNGLVSLQPPPAPPPVSATAAVGPIDDVQYLTDQNPPDGALARGDFTYITLNDALWNNLGRRVDNPAFASSNAVVPQNPRYNAFTYSDSIALAYKFCLRPASGAVISNAESCMPYTVGASGSVPMVPYAPNQVSQWFGGNFDYASNMPAGSSNSGNYPIRSIIVPRNPVSIAISAHNMGTAANPILPGSVVFGANMTNSYPTCAAMLPYPLDAVTHDGSQTLPAKPVKACANTSTFEDLWRAYWNVMCDDSNDTSPPAWAVPSSNNNWQGIFGNPIRDCRATLGAQGWSGGNQFPAGSVMLLRAALAAANVCNFRDGINLTGTGTAPGAVAFDFFEHDGFEGTEPYILKAATNAELHIALPMNGPNTDAAGNATLTVFGYKPQPFITEVYFNGDEKTKQGTAKNPNPYGYIAVEVYNPYPFEINLTSCSIAFVARNSTTAGNMVIPNGETASGTTATSATEIALSTGDSWVSNAPTGPWAVGVIPPHGFLVIENYNGSSTTTGAPGALGRPVMSGLPQIGTITNGPGTSYPNANFVFTKYLACAQNSELILLRGAWASVTADASNGNVLQVQYKIPEFTAGFGLAIPMDQVDLTGFVLPNGGASTSASLGSYPHVHYVRATPNPSGTNPDPAAWQFVYPGKYNPSINPTGPNTGGPYRLDGLEPSWANANFPAGAEPSFPHPVRLGTYSAQASSPNSYAGGQFVHAPIQLPLLGAAGRNQPTNVTGCQFPFGSYARPGDILQAPFIGAYSITNPTTTTNFIEMNSITMDASLADDNQDTPGALQNIGRFCPLGNPQAASVDYQDPTTTSNKVGNGYRYQFAMKLFDYISTIENPNADRTPNVAPDCDGGQYGGSLASYPPAGSMGEKAVAVSTPVPNGNGILTPEHASSVDNGAEGYDYWSDVLGTYSSETNTGTDGLVNVNTASWRVLAALPLVPNITTSGNTYANTTNWAATASLAQAIVYFRDYNDGSGHGHGAFKNLWELNMVPSFSTAVGALSTTTPPNDTCGDYWGDSARMQLSNVSSSAFRTINDWETTSLMVNRVSNLLTTRSDSFTVYVQVQGWSNAGSSQAQMVSQRRLAFIVDRCGVSGPSQAVPTAPANKTPRTYNVPVN